MQRISCTAKYDPISKFLGKNDDFMCKHYAN